METKIIDLQRAGFKKKQPENQSETMMRQVSRFGWNFNKLQQLKMMLSSFFWPPRG